MVLIYNRKYDILLQKKERGRETKGEDDLEEQTSLKTWGDLEIWGVYAVLIHEDHLTDPQICLNLKIVDEYPPWTVSSLKKNHGWKTKSPFGMAGFQGLCYLSPGNENNHGVTSLWSRSRWSSGCVDYGWGFSISKTLCDWKLQLAASFFTTVKKHQETGAQTLYPLNSIVNTFVNTSVTLGLVVRGSYLHTTTSEVASE